MTKSILTCAIVATIAFTRVTIAQHLHVPEPQENEQLAAQEREAFERMRSADPQTGQIPDGIRQRELQFAARSFVALKPGDRPLAASNWHSRGPNGIGGRTRALAIDVANEHNILAGGTTGGMWRSSDDGTTWARMTPLDLPPSVTCVAQDTRATKRNRWYYGTGELGGNTGGWPLWLVSGSSRFGDYYGNGIYTSNDSGLSWQLLTSTYVDTLGRYTSPFNYVHRIAVDPSATADIVYAAVGGGIERSTDAGRSWTMVLGDPIVGGGFSDVQVTSNGILYAFLGSLTVRAQTATIQGLFRSTDGTHWTKITPATWRGASWYTTIAIPRINENIVYFGCDDTTNASALFKYTYLSGDGSGDGGRWDDRSASIGAAGGVYRIGVAPEDTNMVFIGGVNLIRSSNGFVDDSALTELYPMHADMNAFAFYTSDPHRAIFGTDGGMYLSQDFTTRVPDLRSLNDSYTTTQFYTVAVDHATPGSNLLVGGMQDNSTFLSLSDDAAEPWTALLGGDGAGCAIQDSAASFVVSYQRASMYRMAVDEFGSLLDYAPIKPTGLGSTLFFNPLLLDPTDTKRLYIPGGTAIWRCDDLDAIPYGSTAPPAGAWKELTKTRISRITDRVPTPMLTALAASVKPAGRLVYGTNDGRLFLLEQATATNPAPTDIWTGKGFPTAAYVSSVTIDPDNADRIFIAFGNYNVQSLYFTSDAGSTWTPISGNLEEFADGHGNGPACRSVAILHSGTGIVYLVGTTTGLYSTSSLNGMSTQWTLEGPTTIGNNIVNAIDTRSSDGLVVVGTCGNGVFAGNVEPRSTVSSRESAPLLDVTLTPNPASETLQIQVSAASNSPIHVRIADQLGHKVNAADIIAGSSGKAELEMSVSHLPSGVYYCEIQTGSRALVREVIVRH